MPPARVVLRLVVLVEPPLESSVVAVVAPPDALVAVPPVALLVVVLDALVVVLLVALMVALPLEPLLADF